MMGQPSLQVLSEPLKSHDGFKSDRQTDDYADFNSTGKDYALTHVGCMNHARDNLSRRRMHRQKVESESRQGRYDTPLHQYSLLR